MLQHGTRQGLNHVEVVIFMGFAKAESVLRSDSQQEHMSRSSGAVEGGSVAWHESTMQRQYLKRVLLSKAVS